MSAPPQPASAWTEPPWSGWIETTGDALLILEAARRGLIPRVTRRLVDSERKMICSGSVFVFDEDESGIKRWTDGFFWSPSRILGNFLLYRETDKRGSGHRGSKSEASSDNNEHHYNDSSKLEGSLSRPKGDDAHLASSDKRIERTLMGSLTNSYKFKPDGLMKKTFSLTIGGVSQHLISYYKIEDVQNGRLRPPSSLPELASLDISPEYLDKTHFRNPPKVEVGADGIPRYRGEADDIDSSPPLTAAVLSTAPVHLADMRPPDASNSNRRGKRFEPYNPPAAAKRPRRPTKSGEPSTPPEQPVASPVSTPTAESSQPVTAPHYLPPPPPPPPFATPYGASTGYYPVLNYSYPQTHVYYPQPTAAAPTSTSHTPPAGGYQYSYPNMPSTSAADHQQHPSPDSIQPQPQHPPTVPIHSPPPPAQGYYPYPPQQYPGPWPGYAYPTIPPQQTSHVHIVPQSSIASVNASEETDASQNSECEGG
ncbi:hypothetical protein H0H93_005664 [Arthromyces matolae]|nr:hypothetical protein H0H93_005664 [Arthromyces matolae]